VATVVDDEGVEDEAKEEGEEEYNIRWERNKNLISPQTFYWYGVFRFRCLALHTHP
jgi:hypothetical protein